MTAEQTAKAGGFCDPRAIVGGRPANTDAENQGKNVQCHRHEQASVLGLCLSS